MMKTVVKIVTFLFVFTIFSCNDWNPNSPSSIYGKWNLTYASFGLSGAVNVKKGKYIWYINSAKGELTVENNRDEEGFMGLNTGVYKLQITDSTVRVMKSKEDYYQGDYFLKEGKLHVTNNPEVDGPAYMFERD